MKTTQSSMANLRTLALIGALAWSAAATHAADYSTTLSGLNPQGYWRLNEASGPVSTGAILNTGTNGSSLDGSYYAQPLAQQVGALGNGNDPAVSFDGLTQFVEIPYNAALNPTGPFTVEFWANLTNDTAGAKSGVVSRYITVPGGPTGQFGYLFFVNNGNTTWQFRVYNGSSATTINDAMIGDVQPDTWYHVVGVYDGANITIYVNGQPTSTTSGTVVYRANTNAPTRIAAGTPETGPSLYFPGLLDNVAIYHYVLSASEIAAHYDAATTNAAGYNAQVLAANPAAYYAMNEAALPPAPKAANTGALGSAYDGTYTYGATKGAVGPRKAQFFGMDTDNKSVDLNGTLTGPNLSSGFVNISPLPLTTDHCTLTAWVKRTGSQPNFAGIIATRPTSTGLFFTSANNLAYTWNDAPNTYNYNSGLTIPDGVWTFVAMALTPSNAILYLGGPNGLRAVTNNVTHAAHDWSTAPLWLGRDTSTARFMKGNIDEAAMFDTYLDYGTISNLFYAATPSIPLVTVTPAAPYFEGGTITLAAFGVGSTPVTYQWRKAGSNLSGKTASTLVLANALVSDSGDYDVVVTAGALSVTSAVTSISVVASAPLIVQQPASATRFEGAAVTFSVGIHGSVPRSFQWKKGGADITDATNSSYTIPTVVAANAGDYSAAITNPLGSTNSATASLTVLPVSNYAAQLSYGGAAAYWQMNEKAGTTAFDYVGGLNCNIVGPITNNVTSVRPPTYAGYDATNTCFAFQGGAVNDGLVTPSALVFTNTSISVAGWVMPYSERLAISSDVNFVYNVGSVGLNSAGTDGKVRAHPLWWIDTGMTFSFDIWNYIVVVWTPSGQTFYLDNGDGGGLRASSVNGTVDPGTWQGNPFYIGRQAARTDRGWPGQIDELALFDRALTPAEVTNLYLTAISGPAAPSIATQPAPQAVFVGQSATFTVGTLGALPMTYQWKRDGTDLPGATDKSLVLPEVYYTDAGSYSVGITNSQGFANSQAALLSVAAPPTFASLTDDLVLHLKFDDDVQDSSGRGNHGTTVGAPSFVAGKLGKALHYHTETAAGTYDYVTLGIPADLQFGYTTNFSVAYWVKFTGLPGDLPFLCSAANSYGNFGLTFAPSYNAGGWSYWLGSDLSSTGLYGQAGSLNDGNWHSLVHTFDRTGNAVTYLDGVQVDSRSIVSVGSVDSGLPFMIGQAPNGDYQEDGQADIDDLGIWQRAFSATEAQSVYQVGVQGKSFDTYGPVSLRLQKSGDDLELLWESGTLQSADAVDGQYNPVAGAIAPYHRVTPGPGKKFYRVKL